ncbi:MAG: hypothetical protein K8T25_06840 [Planctomycetia bacterium]|nr:hypothetical protein [Planctomycetia bacterium]
MQSTDDWIEIIPPMAHEDARRLYQDLKAARAAAGHDVNEDHVRIDYLVGVKGTADVRYCVLRSELT